MLFMSLYDGNVHQELFLCGSAAAASAHSQTIVTPTVRQVCAAALQPSSSSLKERHQLEAPGPAAALGWRCRPAWWLLYLLPPPL